MIHFDFEERYQDEDVVGSAINKRDGVVVSTLVHALILGLILFGPEMTFLKSDPAKVEARQQELLRQQRERQRFVFVQPRVDFEAKQPPPRAEFSDIDRKAQSPQRVEKPSNPLPFSRGETTERTESEPEERARGPETQVPPTPEPPKPQPPDQVAKLVPPSTTGLRREVETSRPAPGRLGDALRNLDRYIQNQTFNNPQGGQNDPGSTIQFDTKGIDFGPWLRRFVAQVKRNWIIPQSAMVDHGHVVLQFTVHRDGQITDVVVVKPSANPSFTRAAVNAITGSNPVEPLPPDYPAPAISPFTVTFFYNEQPPG